MQLEINATDQDRDPSQPGALSTPEDRSIWRAPVRWIASPHSPPSAHLPTSKGNARHAATAAPNQRSDHYHPAGQLSFGGFWYQPKFGLPHLHRGQVGPDHCDRHSKRFHHRQAIAGLYLRHTLRALGAMQLEHIERNRVCQSVQHRHRRHSPSGQPCKLPWERMPPR